MTREQDIRNAVEVLRQGGVILYPTDTVWGIGCDATNEEAVRKVYEIKQREDSKALICLVDSDARMQRYVRNVPDVAWQLIDSLQDADSTPTTLILDGAINLAPNLIAEDGSIALRITQEAFSKELCYRFQKALVSTSANISGQPAAQNYCDIDPQLLERLLEPTPGAQAPQAVIHHPPAAQWRGDHYPQVKSYIPTRLSPPVLNIRNARAQYQARARFLLSTPVHFLFPLGFLPDSPSVSPRFSGGFSQRDGTSLSVSILHNVGSAVHLVSTFTNKYFEI